MNTCEQCGKPASWCTADATYLLRYACTEDLGYLLELIGEQGMYPRSGRFDVGPFYPWHATRIQWLNEAHGTAAADSEA